MAKITKTYSIDEKIYEAFEQAADDNNINKSSFIEGCINKYLEDNNRGFVDKVYILKTNPSYSVTIRRKDDTFYYLNDGSKIPIILFMQMYKEVDADSIKMNPNEFFKNPTFNSDAVQSFLSKTGYEDSEKVNS
jgi:hypothetical protein